MTLSKTITREQVCNLSEIMLKTRVGDTDRSKFKWCVGFDIARMFHILPVELGEAPTLFGIIVEIDYKNTRTFELWKEVTL